MRSTLKTRAKNWDGSNGRHGEMLALLVVRLRGGHRLTGADLELLDNIVGELVAEQHRDAGES